MLEAMDFSPSGLFAGFVFGVIGIWLFRKGKKEAEFDFIFIGLALMVYPYFTKGPWGDWGIGAALCSLAYYRPYRGL
jgi:hypothetical protein